MCHIRIFRWTDEYRISYFLLVRDIYLYILKKRFVWCPERILLHTNTHTHLLKLTHILKLQNERTFVHIYMCFLSAHWICQNTLMSYCLQGVISLEISDNAFLSLSTPTFSTTQLSVDDWLRNKIENPPVFVGHYRREAAVSEIILIFKFYISLVLKIFFNFNETFYIYFSAWVAFVNTLQFNLRVYNNYYALLLVFWYTGGYGAWLTDKRFGILFLPKR